MDVLAIAWVASFAYLMLLAVLYKVKLPALRIIFYGLFGPFYLVCLGMHIIDACLDEVEASYFAWREAQAKKKKG